MGGRNVLLEEIVNFHYGKGLKSDDRDNGSFNVYGANGIVGKHSEKVVDYDTIIIGRKGSVGKVTLALGGGWPIDTTFYIEIKDKESVSLSYLYHSLKNTDLERLAITTSIPGINKKTLNSIQIWLPEISEQNRIATILNKILESKDNIRRLDEHYDMAYLAMSKELL